MRIGSFPPIQTPLAKAAKLDAGQQSEDFAGKLMDVLREVNSMQQNAAEKQTDRMAGRNADIADVKIAMEEASLALNLTLQVRNKVLEAYQEIARMQV